MAGMNVAELFFTVAGRLNAKVFNDLDKKVNQSNKTISSLGKGIGGGIGKAVGGILAGLGGAVAINQLIETGKQLDSINKKFVIIGGSQEKANELLKQSRDLAFKLGLPLSDVQEGMGKFLAGGIGGSLTQPELIKTFEDMSYAIAGLGLPADKAQRTFKALGDIIGKDQIYAEELTQQLGENMPGAAPQTAKALGVLQKELRKMMKDGKLGARTLLKMSSQFKQTYGKNALNNVNGITGSLENMNNSFIELQRALLTSGLTDIIIDIATELTNILENDNFKKTVSLLGKSFKDIYVDVKGIGSIFLSWIPPLDDTVLNLKTIKSIIYGIGAFIGSIAMVSAISSAIAFIVPILISIWGIIGGIITTIAGAGGIFEIFAFIIGALVSIVGWIPLIIGLAVAGITLIALNWDKVVASFKYAGEIFGQTFRDIGNIINKLLIQPIKSLISMLETGLTLVSKITGLNINKKGLLLSMGASTPGGLATTTIINNTNNNVVQNNHNPTSTMSQKQLTNAVGGQKSNSKPKPEVAK